MDTNAKNKYWSTHRSVLTCMVSPSACVTAATAAAQAGAALVQTVGNQTRDDSSLRTLITFLSSQHVFLQTRREAAATLSLFILESKVGGKDSKGYERLVTFPSRVYQLISENHPVMTLTSSSE